MSIEIMESSKIDLVNKTDFTKGFQSFHINWPLKDLSWPKSSSNFTTSISNANGTLSIDWYLNIDKDEVDNTRFGLRLQTRGKLVPAIYRLSATVAYREPLFDSCAFAIFGFGQSGVFTHSTKKAAKFQGDDLALHCWIDLPKAIIDYNPEKMKIDASNVGNKKVVGGVELFNNVTKGEDIFSDVSLVIMNGSIVVREFLCHRLILSSRSSVFDRLFANSQWKENRDGKRAVEIIDIDEKTMEIVLNFIYVYSLPDKSIDKDLIPKIIYAADKYDLPDLKQRCVSILILEEGSTAKRVGQWRLADDHQLNQLKSLCVGQLSMQWFKNVDREDVTEHLMSEIIQATFRQYQIKEIMCANASRLVRTDYCFMYHRY